MGEIMLNGRPYSAGISYKELTQAEYNALPDSKYTDGIMYCIKDGTGGVEGFPPLIYSTEEREIGVWTNGKPLYQKTVHWTGSLNSGQLIIVDSNINLSNADVFISDIAFFKFSGYSHTTSSIMGKVLDVELVSQGVCIENFTDFTIIEIWVTYRYTKTTDVAGSGQWTTQGEVAHHYSTAERVIGTWIDGKPIYEKTMHFPKSELTSKDMYINHNISNLDKIIDIRGAMRAENQNLIITGYQWGSDWGCSIGDVTSTTFYLRMGGGRYSAVTEVDIIFQYTKTTD